MSDWTEWKFTTTYSSVDATRYTRHGIVRARRRGWVGYTERRNLVTRKTEVQKCGHAHDKRANAHACAKKLAKMLNTYGARVET